MPPNAPQCFACLKILSPHGQGISLSGSGTPNVCKDCWTILPRSRRIMLQLLARPTETGGLGIAELCAKISAAIDRAGEPPSPFPWRN